MDFSSEEEANRIVDEARVGELDAGALDFLGVILVANEERNVRS